MSTTITLPAHLRDSHLLAGIRFEDGTATVDTIGSNARHFFALVGAFITDPETADAAPDADLRHGDRLLSDHTVDELRELANIEGIALPSKAVKPEILAIFAEALTKED
jgi:hypothetical protein